MVALQILTSCSYIPYVWCVQAILGYLLRLRKNLTQSGGESGPGAQVPCCFPTVVFLSKASLNTQQSTFLIATNPFLVREKATVPHMKEDDITFHMNPIALTSRIKQCCFQTKHTLNQPARWVTNMIWGNLNNVNCVTDITKWS